MYKKRIYDTETQSAVNICIMSEKDEGTTFKLLQFIIEKKHVE